MILAGVLLLVLLAAAGAPLARARTTRATLDHFLMSIPALSRLRKDVNDARVPRFAIPNIPRLLRRASEGAPSCRVAYGQVCMARSWVRDALSFSFDRYWLRVMGAGRDPPPAAAL